MGGRELENNGIVPVAPEACAAACLPADWITCPYRSPITTPSAGGLHNPWSWCTVMVDHPGPVCRLCQRVCESLPQASAPFVGGNLLLSHSVHIKTVLQATSYEKTSTVSRRFPVAPGQRPSRRAQWLRQGKVTAWRGPAASEGSQAGAPWYRQR
ncbi:unnamed protein product [Pleuronectes platessa]|uniref:Uncharacterized protein n=1 Tax=Pleuronectes platessa TaxID=8262 RepID=A0A9N7YJ32_PLEPL|nr:unnamed protein product [Pleuronectes platessa]